MFLLYLCLIITFNEKRQTETLNLKDNGKIKDKEEKL